MGNCDSSSSKCEDNDDQESEKSNQNMEFSEPVMWVLKKIFKNDSITTESAHIQLKELKSDIKSLSKNDINYNRIVDYIKNTHGPTHTFSISVENIYVTERTGERKDFETYKTIGNCKMLWHGTRLTNYVSILSTGLLTKPPPDVCVSSRKMFGDGIYFADVVTKAAQYCKADIHNPYGVLILAQVALGNELKLTRSENVKLLPSGTNSVKGIGRYQHKSNVIIDSNIEIPLGNLEFRNNISTALDYNEYIIYNEKQILIEYLVLVKFNYR